ncbi:MAG: peptide MFS transporter [Flavobacteriales bacterium]|nr:peptide MFS transporter [Flavobacteriales bacterium]
MDLTLKILIVGWIFVLLWVPFIIYTNKKTHPAALFVLFGAEMWERFSYYGMRALLTLYMAKVLFVDLGQQIADTKALAIYGSYTSMVYLFPVIGGLVADRIFGFRKTILFGGILMMLGHFTLALEDSLLPGSLAVFFLALALIIVGNAYFKPNISSFLGEFYEKNDPRKDGAFTIFYMGVNIGAFLSTLTCGYVGEKINWHYGFGLAGIGMGLGLVTFMILGPKLFGKKGLKPAAEAAIEKIASLPSVPFVYIASILFVPVCALLLNYGDIMATALIAISLGILGYLIWYGFQAKSKGEEGKIEGQRIWVVAVLFVFHAVFWALFEQAGGSLTLFTDRNVDRVIFGNEIPASIFQSLNPLYIMLLAPVFSWMWLKLNKKDKEPSTPMKFVLGLTQLGLGFGIVVLGATLFGANGMVPVVFIFVMYLLHTTGELSLSPVGLSMITKLAPGKIVGFVMGAWFLSIALANKIAGEIGRLTANEDIPADASITETLAVYTSTYLNWGVFVVLGAAFILLLLVPTLKKWMNGIH